MADTEYKRWDSDSGWWMNGAELKKDPEVRDGANGKMVRLTLVSTSRREGNDDLWVEVNVSDFNADAAAWMKKNDVLHRVEGKDFMRTFGEGKKSFGVERARLSIGRELMKTLRERGFSPGTGNAPTSSAKPAAAAKKSRQPRQTLELPED